MCSFELQLASPVNQVTFLCQPQRTNQLAALTSDGQISIYCQGKGNHHQYFFRVRYYFAKFVLHQSVQIQQNRPTKQQMDSARCHVPRSSRKPSGNTTSCGAAACGPAECAVSVLSVIFSLLSQSDGSPEGASVPAAAAVAGGRALCGCELRPAADHVHPADALSCPGR